MSDLSSKRPAAAPPAARPSLRDLQDIRPLYFLPKDPFVYEVLIPAFRAASAVDCMAGFFSSGVLAEVAPGLAAFLARSRESIRLVISPFLSQADQSALEQGTADPTTIAASALEELLVTEDLLQKHTLRCLSHLLRAGRIEIRVALMKEALFHPKVWLFKSDGAVLAAHGSSNLTRAGVRANFEQVTVSNSWDGANPRYTTGKLQEQFTRLWDNREGGCQVVGLPIAIRERLLRDHHSDEPPTEAEFRSLYEKATRKPPPAHQIRAEERRPDFHIPDGLVYDSGPFAHQGRAVDAWCAAAFRGTLEMATGSGKTITSMLCAHRLLERAGPLLIVVAAPYLPLIDQWCEEVAGFGLRPINLSAAGNAVDRTRTLQQAARRLRTAISRVELAVVSHDTLCTEDFVAAIERFECQRLLIADEAHNLGSQGFITNPPQCFEHRLALSATPARQYDPEGTHALVAYFGPVVFRFTLREAIGTCLVEYDYYVHPVRLTDDEMDRWRDLTGEIRKHAWRLDEGKADEFLTKLLRDRRLILETAANKLTELGRLLDETNLRNLRHALVYASDKAPEQLVSINAMLRARGVLFHQLTHEETADRKETQGIIRSFQDGDIQVLTAKRVLDEGVNIPQIQLAYVLASTTVERQWVQRRGRLLRTCAATGKTHSVIHDFLTLPPETDGSLDKDERTLLRSELTRIQEFAALARNAGSPGGALHVVHDIVKATMM